MRAWLLALLALPWVSVSAGPYSAGSNDPRNVYDAPIPGFVGPDGEGKAALANGDGSVTNPRNFVNPLFFGWATGWQDYLPSDARLAGSIYGHPEKALGPVTGDLFDIVSLGDLTQAQLNAHAAPGCITLTFPKPIRNKSGADFVVFENASVSAYDTGGSGVGGVFAELAYVEVSSNGTDFARFPSASLIPYDANPYRTIDPTDAGGLAGKHLNAYGDSWGTPFDLAALAGDPLVTGGSVNLAAVTRVRVVDIPGRGTFLDSAGRPIYDPWLTSGSGGFDLEAVGVVSQDTDFDEWQDRCGLSGAQRGPAADPDGDGVPNLLEYAFGLAPLLPDAGGLPSLSTSGDRVAISFSRDTRNVDLTYEVQASGDLAHWTPIARSVAGGDLVAAAPSAPAIADASASPIASVGVVRRETVADVVTFAGAARRFLRVQVLRSSP